MMYSRLNFSRSSQDTRQDLRHKARQDKTRQDKTGQDRTRQDKTRQDKTRQDKTRQDKTRQDKTRQDRTFILFSNKTKAKHKVLRQGQDKTHVFHDKIKIRYKFFKTRLKTRQ